MDQDETLDPNSKLLMHVIGLLNALQRDVHELREKVAGRVKPLLTVEELAELVGRSAYTIRRWINEDRIKAIRVDGSGPRGRLLIPQSELASLVESGLGAKLPPAIADNDAADTRFEAP